MNEQNFEQVFSRLDSNMIIDKKYIRTIFLSSFHNYFNDQLTHVIRHVYMYFVFFYEKTILF